MSDQQPPPQPQNLPPQPQWGPQQQQQPGPYPPPAQGPYQQPAYGQAPYPQPGYGQPPYPQDPYAFGYGHPYAAVVPRSMPGEVRAAQIVIFSMAGLSALSSVIMSVVSGAEAAGYAMGANLCGWVLIVFAFLFDSGRGGVRVTCIVFASLQILAGLGAIGAHRPSGALLGLAAVAVVVLLSRRTAGQWFGRPRTPGPGQGYAA